MTAVRRKNVWIDSVWLPTLSYTMAKRAFQEWLEIIPSNRIMWGADTVQAQASPTVMAERRRRRRIAIHPAQDAANAKALDEQRRGDQRSVGILNPPCCCGSVVVVHHQ